MGLKNVRIRKSPCNSRSDIFNALKGDLPLFVGAGGKDNFLEQTGSKVNERFTVSGGKE